MISHIFFYGNALKTLSGPQARIGRLNELVNSQGYHISIGKAWLHDCADVKEMVSAAESFMYEEKRLYYQKMEMFPRRAS